MYCLLQLLLLLLIELEFLRHELLLLFLPCLPLLHALLVLDGPETAAREVTTRIVIIRQVLLRVHAPQEGTKTSFTSMKAKGNSH